MQPTVKRNLFIAIFMLITTASTSADDLLSIDSIDVQLFSHEDGQFHSFDDPPNPYGMNMDLLILVKLKGKMEYAEKPSELTLTAIAPGWSDEATGSHPEWQQMEQKAFHHLPENGERHFLFVLPYEDCYPEVTLSAGLSWQGGDIQKTRKISLACAE
jgi:hypothetical protein